MGKSNDVQEFQEFNVGDIVRVVDTPYRDCPFSWAAEMTDYCSRQATIVKKTYVSYRKTYWYQIELDNGRFSWCGNCFIPLDSGSEIEAASDDELLEFLM